MLAGRRTTDNRRSGNWSGSVPARVPRWFAYPLSPHTLSMVNAYENRWSRHDVTPVAAKSANTRLSARP